MSIPGGYILLARRLDESDIMHEPPVVREVWLYILRKVSHKDQTGYKKSCKRGENFFRLADIQKDLSWSVGFRPMKYSKPQLTKAIRRLREGNMIATQKATRGIYISVLNYDFFQDPTNYEGNGEKSTKETRRKHEGAHIEQECKNDKNKEKSCTSSKKQYTDEFEKFWQAYPKKVGKGAAYKAWSRINGKRPKTNELVEIIEKHKQSRQWKLKQGQFIPNPQTWLNQERWLDELEATNNQRDEIQF